MTSGASDLGDKGCLGGGGVNVRDKCTPALISCPELSRIIWGFSSSTGPVMQDVLCCRQSLPGKLIDRSCKAGRPGIVAMSC